MSLLDHQEVHDFWSSYDDPFIYKVIAFMESVEDWTADSDPELETALTQLSDAISDIGNIELKQEEDFVKLVGSLKTGRGLRLLMTLDMAYPGAASKVIMHAEKTTQSEKDVPGAFLKRNIIFERLRLLGRIFSPERIELIQNSLEDSDI